MKNVRFTLISLVIATLLLLIATLADAAPVPPGTIYDASTGVVNWSAPTLDTAGNPIQPGGLKDCFWSFTWTAGGSMLVTARDVTAGTSYAISVPVAFGTGAAVGYCTTALDAKGDTGAWPVVFRVPPTPQAPVLTK
jgi:hypothetical protein